MLVPLVLAALAYALYTSEKPRPAIASIMVLPLENISGDSAEEYFADGMTDALIGDLAKIGGLHVISRTSSMHYKGTKKSLPEIAREINVDAIVEGTVQRSGDRVVIRTQLIHAPTDRHLWVRDYTRDMRDVLDLQSEIAASRRSGSAHSDDARRTGAPFVTPSSSAEGLRRLICRAVTSTGINAPKKISTRRSPFLDPRSKKMRIMRPRMLVSPTVTTHSARSRWVQYRRATRVETLKKLRPKHFNLIVDSPKPTAPLDM